MIRADYTALRAAYRRAEYLFARDEAAILAESAPGTEWDGGDIPGEYFTDEARAAFAHRDALARQHQPCRDFELMLISFRDSIAASWRRAHRRGLMLDLIRKGDRERARLFLSAPAEGGVA